jgi:threonine dehydrogenase-like Zn-dependent dehydrogenase
LVAGLGPIGLLTTFALHLRRAEVLGLDVVDAGSKRPTLLAKIGGVYLDGRQAGPEEVSKKYGHIDLILEATGVARVVAATGTFVSREIFDKIGVTHA